jgi:hypothetical protein
MINLPKRLHGDVGKDIGGNTYVHRDYEDVIPGIEEAKRVLVSVPYNIVKHNRSTGTISFITCNDFDNDHEPEVGMSVVHHDGHMRIVMPPVDPWIYHHKWLMVRDDYKGFDIEESIERSLAWMSIPNVDHSRIGRKSYWLRNVVPKIPR